MFLPGDIIFAHGGNWVSEAIRWAEQHPGQPEPYANHVAGFVSGVDIVEALATVQQHPYADCGTGTGPNQVWRCKTLSDAQRICVAQAAQEYIGDLYGVGKIALDLGDALISKAEGREVYFFRRAIFAKEVPICSFVWSKAYSTALGMSFGLPAAMAEPSDMHAFVKASPAWQLVAEVKREGK